MKRAAFTLAGVAMALAVPASAANPITGRWITEDRDAVITIAPCGASLCGKISKFLVAPPQGVDQRDINNPDPQLRQRRLLDTPILSNLREDGDSWKGEIYDPKRGRSFRSVVRRAGPGTLEVKGCAGPFCQTQTWRRAN